MVERGAPAKQSERGRRTARVRLGLCHLVIVALVVSPIALGAVSLTGGSWYPAGDWAHLVFRVSQVGGADTPLVGAYSVHGFAHPGPLGFWLAAPLFRVTGGEPLSLAWTAALINIVAVGALAAVAWSRGRRIGGGQAWPLLVGVMALAALLVRGFGPEELVDPWNPYLALWPFTLTLFLLWDAALGRRRSLVLAVAPASLAMQSHLGMVALVGLGAVWLLVWLGWVSHWFGPGRDSSRPNSVSGVLRELWGTWRRPVIWAGGVAAVLWSGPLLDALVGARNPRLIAGSLKGGGSLGPVDAVGLVGRYVRPDGPWMGGAEPRGSDYFSVVGSGPLPLLVALAVLAGCAQVAHRRGLRDVGALATLAITLVVGAVPATARLPVPVEAYLTQWLKVVGALVWFTAAWTVWRVALSSPSAPSWGARRVSVGPLSSLRVSVVVAAGLVGAILLAVPASQWSAATSVELPVSEAGEEVEVLYEDLGASVPKDQRIRLVRRGEYFHIYGATLFYLLARDGYDVVTDEGASGLKWGSSHRWRRGDDFDVLLTIAIDRANDECLADRTASQVASYDGLTAAERQWLTDVRFRRLADPEAITPEEQERSDALDARDMRLGVYEGPRPCAPEDDFEESGAGGESGVQVAATVLVIIVAAASWFVLARRRAAAASDVPVSAPAGETTTGTRDEVDEPLVDR